MLPHSSPPLAFSYIRFSSPEQAKGDSLRRQTEAAADWCARSGVTLDTVTTFRDLGKSAYTGTHRTNPDRHALAAFLKLVESGKVPRGSFLIIENLDRLSREHIQPALLLALNLLQAGIRIVQLKPSEIVFDDKSDTLPVMMMMMELSRGHGESAIKSERVSAAWVTKRRKALESGEVMTRLLPKWIEEKNGKLHLIPERAAVVKRIFRLAATGHGSPTIAHMLDTEGIPTFGRKDKWSRSYIAKLLKDRTVLGELEPRRKKKAEPVIPNYYPAVVTEDEWHAARAGAVERTLRPPGRTDNFINPFAGLLFDALTGEPYWTALRHWKGRAKQRFLINQSAAEGRPGCRTFPYETFDRAVRRYLKEIDPHEILNGDSGPDESLIIAGELERKRAKREEIEAELLTGGESAALARLVRQLEIEERELGERLAAAKQKAASPLSETWGEVQALPDNLTDEQKLRLRSALRRIVDCIQVIAVPRGRDRLCAVQIWFAGGKKHRDYLILNRPDKANGSARVKGCIKVNSRADLSAGLDLHKKADAKKLEKLLAAVDLQTLAEAMSDLPALTDNAEAE